MDGNDLVGSYKKIESLKEISTDDMIDLCFSQPTRPKDFDGRKKYGVNSIIVKLVEPDEKAFDGYSKEEEDYHMQIVDMIENKARYLCHHRQY